MIDAINSVFELGAAVLLTLNVYRVAKDGHVAGVSIVPTAWMSLWGAWNLYYYAALGQRWSWVAGVAVFLVNTIWVGLAVFSNWRKR